MNKPFKWALHINFFVYAILLNSVGIVILKSINNYGVSEVQASTLELFKDMPVAIVSFLIASFCPPSATRKSWSLPFPLPRWGCFRCGRK